MSQSNGHPALLGDLQQRIDDYFTWLRDRTVLREVPDDSRYCKITTPHLDRHNDCLVVYVRRDDGGYLLTDDSAIINDLEISGCKLDSPKRRQLLRTTLNGFGVEINGSELQVKAGSQNFAHKKHDLIQAMLAVDDMFALASPTVASLFIEDVTAWLDEIDVRYVSNIKLAGKSGYDHTFDFVIPKSRQAPERVVQAINRPTKDSAELFDFKWIDTRDARDRDSQAFAILNDQEQNVPGGVIDALANYEIEPVLWSDRQRVQDQLAA